MKALRNLILLEELDGEVQHKSGLFLPTVAGNPDPEVEDSSTKFKRGRVVSTGYKVNDAVQVGDVVLFSPKGCVHVRDQEKIYTVATEENLLVKE